MTQIELIISLTILYLVPSCASDRNGPEEVLNEFYVALQEGDCEKLKAVSSDEGVEMMYDWLALGCEPIHTTVDSIYCNTLDSVAYCSCYETRENGSIRLHYVLELIEDEWKVTPRGKDIELPGDSWDRSTQN